MRVRITAPFEVRMRRLVEQIRYDERIESGISWLKRCLGLTRCTWKGWDSVEFDVWALIVAANLSTIGGAKPAT